MQIQIKNIAISVLALLFVVSLGANIFLFATFQKAKTALQEKIVNEKVLAFRNLFTEKVLLSNREVDFDTRLLLENAVRALNDQEIFDQWKMFTESSTKEAATFQAKRLLQILIDKTAAY